MTAPNGSNWTPRSSGTADNLRAIAYGNGTFVAVGNSGIILTSPDGIDWVERTSILSTNLLGVGYGSGKYVIGGQNGEILTSPDSTGWTAQASGVSNFLNGVVYDNERFVILGEEVILYSLCETGSPTITITSPNGGENVIAGTNLEITWATTGTIGDVKIEYSINSGTSWTEIVSSYPGNGTYDWTLPGTPSTDCLVRVSEIDGDPSDISDSEFSILPASGASITVTSPNGGEILAAGPNHEVTWTTTGTIDNVFIQYSIDNGTTWKTITLSTVNDGTYDWTVPDTASNNCLVRAGNSETED
ncbi:MAG: hypothetical protein GY869_28385, partial [Planctomycetes bacterium]|nr:hypothetical protein [Planctomycetota bacterium]